MRKMASNSHIQYIYCSTYSIKQGNPYLLVWCGQEQVGAVDFVGIILRMPKWRIVQILIKIIVIPFCLDFKLVLVLSLLLLLSSLFYELPFLANVSSMVGCFLGKSTYV